MWWLEHALLSQTDLYLILNPSNYLLWDKVNLTELQCLFFFKYKNETNYS